MFSTQKRLVSCLIFGIILTIAVTGQAKEPEKVSLDDVQTPAWSINHTPAELVVAVSPTRQTLQILGSAGLVIGTSVSAVVDDRYRVRVNEILGDYDPGAVFEAHLQERLEAALEAALAKVEAQVGRGRYHSVHEAREARFDRLSKAGHDIVLDLTITYGIFGSSGTLITRIEGALFELPKGRDLWRNVIICDPMSVLADDASGDPTSRYSPTITSPKLGVNAEEIERWLQDDGTVLKTRFESAVDGVVSALLVDLNLADEAVGHYFLGKSLLAAKEYSSAQTHFNRALALDAGNLEYRSALSVAHARGGQVDEALKVAGEIVQANPGYGPAHYNLAWWYATKEKDAGKAREHYIKAEALGMPSNKKVEKFLKKNE